MERIDAHRPHASQDDRADVTRRQTAVGDGLQRRRLQRRKIVRGFHAVNLRRVDEAAHVFGQPEDGRAFVGVITSDALEDRRAVVNDVRQYVNLGLFVGNQLAVKPDLGFHLISGFKRLNK